MIGLIPAAGSATRMYGLPKFLLPAPTGNMLIEQLVKEMTAVKAEVLIGVSARNLEMLTTYCSTISASKIYQVTTETMSQTLLCAKEYIGDQDVIFGMPDSIWQPDGGYAALLNHLKDGADVAVGLWYTAPKYRSKRGMCKVDNNSDDTYKIVQVIDKPEQTLFEEAWGILAWKQTFWKFIKPEMSHVGYALQPAIDAKLRVDAVKLGGRYHDCGTPTEYFDCIRQWGKKAI